MSKTKKTKSHGKGNALGMAPKKYKPAKDSKKKKHKWGQKRRAGAPVDPESSVLNNSSESDKKTPDVAGRPETLREKMLKRLQTAKFRQVNEELDNETYEDRKDAFGSVEEFRRYHESYSERMKKWPEDPLSLIIDWVNTEVPPAAIIADFGCGEARLAASVPHKVHSFDLYALNERVTACDMSNCPLPDGSVNIAIFCLSLMGTDISKYIVEANRILRHKGVLKIAEVASRFQNNSYPLFVRKMKKFGFVSNYEASEKVEKNQNRTLHSTGEVFFMFEFTKVRLCNRKKSGKTPMLRLNPCFYKRR